MSRSTSDVDPRAKPAVTDAQARIDVVAGALEREEPVLLAAARALTLDDTAARDLVQATFELAIRHAAQLREPRLIRAWLLTIQTREALRLRRRMARFVRLGPSTRDVGSADLGIEWLAIREALATLPPRMRAAVVLHHMAGLSVAEVAQAMETSPNTVKTQLRSGLSRLRDALSDE